MTQVSPSALSKKHPILYVEFDDHAAGANGWVQPEELDASPVKCKAIGWLLKENAQILILGVAVDPRDYQSTARQYIVKSCITKRKVIRT